MLILSREVGERIVIVPDVFVTILEIGGNKVRLGIDAPPEIPVHREEVWRAIRAGGNGRVHIESGHSVRSHTDAT